MSFKFNFFSNDDDSPEPGNFETPLLCSQWTLQQADTDRFDNFRPIFKRNGFGEMRMYRSNTKYQYEFR